MWGFIIDFELWIILCSCCEWARGVNHYMLSPIQRTYFSTLKQSFTVFHPLCFLLHRHKRIRMYWQVKKKMAQLSRGGLLLTRESFQAPWYGARTRIRQTRFDEDDFNWKWHGKRRTKPIVPERHCEAARRDCRRLTAAVAPSQTNISYFVVCSQNMVSTICMEWHLLKYRTRKINTKWRGSRQHWRLLVIFLSTKISIL